MNRKKLSTRMAFLALAMAPFAACDVNNTILSTNLSDGSASPDDAGTTQGDSSSTTGDVVNVPSVPPSQRPAVTCADLNCGPGSCVVTDAVPSCTCPDGFASSGNACLVCTDVANGGRVQLPALTKVSFSLTVNGAPPVPNTLYAVEIHDNTGALVASSQGENVRLPPGNYDLYRLKKSSNDPFPAHWLRSFSVGDSPITVASDERLVEVKVEVLEQGGQAWPKAQRRMLAIAAKDGQADLQPIDASVEPLMLAPGNYVVRGAFRREISQFSVSETPAVQTVKLTIPLHKVDVDFFVNGSPFVGKTSDLNVNGAVYELIPATSTTAGKYTFFVPTGRWRFAHGGFFSPGSLGVNAILADVEVVGNLAFKVEINPVAVKGSVRLNGQPLQAKGVRIYFTGVGPSLSTGSPKVDETGALTATLLPGSYVVSVRCDPPGCSSELQGSTRGFNVDIKKDQPDLLIDLQTGKLDMAVTESGVFHANGIVSVAWEGQVGLLQASVPAVPNVPASFLAGVYQPRYTRAFRDADFFVWRLDVGFDPVTVQPGQTAVNRRDLRLLQVGIGAGPDFGNEGVWAQTFSNQTFQGLETVGGVLSTVRPDKAMGFEVPEGVYKFGAQRYGKPLGCFRVRP